MLESVAGVSHAWLYRYNGCVAGLPAWPNAWAKTFIRRCAAGGHPSLSDAYRDQP